MICFNMKFLRILLLKLSEGGSLIHPHPEATCLRRQIGEGI